MAPLGDPAAFTIADNWHGGFYELAIELGPPSDERLDRALTTIWEWAGVEGCYGSRTSEPADQPVIPCTARTLDQFGCLRGVTRLPSGVPVVCGALAVRGGEWTDWLSFFIPLGALERAESRVGSFPIGHEHEASLAWRQPIDDWLAGIGAGVYDAVQFLLALIGYEVSGAVSAEELGADPPESRLISYLLPRNGELLYLPATG